LSNYHLILGYSSVQEMLNVPKQTVYPSISGDELGAKFRMSGLRIGSRMRDFCSTKRAFLPLKDTFLYQTVEYLRSRIGHYKVFPITERVDQPRMTLDCECFRNCETKPIMSLLCLRRKQFLCLSATKQLNNEKIWNSVQIVIWLNRIQGIKYLIEAYFLTNIIENNSEILLLNVLLIGDGRLDRCLLSILLALISLWCHSETMPYRSYRNRRVT